MITAEEEEAPPKPVRRYSLGATAFWAAIMGGLGLLAIIPIGWALSAVRRQMDGSLNVRIRFLGRLSPFAVGQGEVKQALVISSFGFLFLWSVAVVVSLLLNPWLVRPVILRWLIGGLLLFGPFFVFWFTRTTAA